MGEREAFPDGGEGSESSAPAMPSARFRRALGRAIVLPLLLMGALTGFFFWQVHHLLSLASWVDRSDQVIAQAHRVENLLLDMETGVRGYRLTGDPEFLQPYEAAAPALDPAVRDLARLVADNPSQLRLAGAVRASAQRWQAYARGELTPAGAPDDGGLAQAREGKRRMDVIRERIGSLIRVEEGLRDQRGQDVRRETRRAATVGAGLAVVLGASLAFAGRHQLTNLSTTYSAVLAAERATAREILDLNEQLERRVHERTAELEAANAELEAFSYSVSHDLRAPLRGITGFSRVLMEDHAERLDADGMQNLRRVCAAGERMARLINDLLALSRLQRSELNIADVDLSALSREIAAELRRSDPAREVEFVIPDGLAVTGDPRLLRVALENLLGNAWKFTAKRPRAHIELGVAGRGDARFGGNGGPNANGGGRITFFVKDDGAGFDPVYAGKLFAPFQRLHAVTDFPGTGVGLASIQRILRRHGGRVWAEGEPGAGATFFFTLRPASADRDPAACFES